MKIIIQVDGGRIDVLCDPPITADDVVAVIDYDTNGCDEEDIKAVPQSADPNDTEEAIVYEPFVDEIRPELLQFVESL
jgi:hypothetical protein